MFARVIAVLEKTLSQPVRVHDDLSEASVIQIRDIAVNTFVQVIAADGAMAALDALSTEEQGWDNDIDNEMDIVRMRGTGIDVYFRCIQFSCTRL